MKRLTAKRKAQIVALFALDWAIRHVAAIYGLTVPQVEQIIRDAIKKGRR